MKDCKRAVWWRRGRRVLKLESTRKQARAQPPCSPGNQLSFPDDPCCWVLSASPKRACEDVMRQWWCRKKKPADGTCLIRGHARHAIDIQPSTPREIEPSIGRYRNIWKIARILVYEGCK